MRWVNVIGFEDRYIVSDTGLVKSINSNKILKPGINKKGYLSVVLQMNCYKKTIRLNRLVAIHFIANPDNKPEVNHRNGDKSNNHKSNLQWVTKSENEIHAHKNGLKPNHGKWNRLLDEKKVKKILNLYSLNKNKSDISRRLKVNRKTVSQIINGNSYKEITGIKIL